MTPQELKLSILLRAFNGKLVDQKPVEGNGKDLFLKISKSNPVKKKIIPFEDEPFEIPDSWIWCPLNELAKIVVGATPSTTRDDYWNYGSIPWIPSGCCKDGPIDESFSQVRYITKAGYESCSTTLMEASTVVIALTGATAGKVGILRFKACGNQSVVGIKAFDGLLPEFVYYCLMARRSEILGDCVGSAQPHISKEYITKMLFPLPPFEEQKRIVAKIEELLPLVDRYEEAWFKLENFNKRFPVDLEKSLLKLAFEGKIQSQSLNNGNANELLNKIIKEKNRLISEKALKKEKELPPITEEELLFDIPSNWQWARLSDVLDVRDGTHDSPKYHQVGIPFVTSKNLVEGKIDFNDCKLISLEDANKFNERSHVDDGDILFAMIGTIGNPVIVKKDREFCIKNMALIKNFAKDLLNTKYVYYYLRFIENNLKLMAQSSVQSFVSLSILRKYLIPIPPLEEQKRIVAKLDELLPLCRKLVK